ncbi:MAG: ATP-dependent zinc protease [Psychromonas sp.]
MFFSKKILPITFTLLAITGCITTESQEQQQKITLLENALDESKTLAINIQTKLDNSTKSLNANEDTITELKNTLKTNQKTIKSNAELKATATTNVIHINNKTILGQTEWVYISKIKDNFKGRIDTGAATSSINAVNIERFERDGEKWVRFNLTHAEDEKAQRVESKVVRIARIRQSNNTGKSIERLVIKLHIRIGDISHLTEFTLTDRLHMAYPVLIGRTFMRDVILVDVSQQYIFPEFQVTINN